MVGLSDPCGVGLSQYENVCGANRYSVGWCRSECHSVQLGGGAIVKAPRPYSQTQCLLSMIRDFSNDDIFIVIFIPSEAVVRVKN